MILGSVYEKGCLGGWARELNPLVKLRESWAPPNLNEPVYGQSELASDMLLIFPE